MPDKFMRINNNSQNTKRLIVGRQCVAKMRRRRVFRLRRPPILTTFRDEIFPMILSLCTRLHVCFLKMQIYFMMQTGCVSCIQKRVSPNSQIVKQRTFIKYI